MAKSTRSKVKRAFRAKKRTEGVYAATEAARLQRLNTKLRALTTAGVDDDDKDDGHETRSPKEDEREDQDQDQDARMPAAAGDGDDAEMKSSTGIEGVEGRATAPKFKGKVSTHGPRGSRRENWRVSKGMAPRAKSRGVNRQGLTAARYKSGRPHRRR